MKALSASAVVVAFLLAGCGSESTPKNEPPGTKGLSDTELVQQRYSDCLQKLKAKNPDPIGQSVTFETKRGLLVFKVVERNGKRFTVPQRAKDVDILTSVGC